MLRHSARALFVARSRAILLQASNRAVGKGATNPTLTSQSAAKNDPNGTGDIQFGKNKEQSAMYQSVGTAWDTMRKVGNASPAAQSIERWEDRYQTEGTGQAPASTEASSGQHPTLWERAKDAVSAVKESISSKADVLKQQAAEKKDEVSAQATETTNTLGDKFQAAKETVADKFANAKETVQEKYGDAKEAVGQKMDNIKDAAKSSTAQSSAAHNPSRTSTTAAWTKVDTIRKAMSEEVRLSDMQGNLSPEDEVLAPMAARSHQTTSFKGIDKLQQAASTEDLSIKANAPETTHVKRPTLRFKPEEPTAEEREDEGLDEKGAWAAAPKNLSTGQTIQTKGNEQKWKTEDTQQWRKGLAKQDDGNNLWTLDSKDDKHNLSSADNQSGRASGSGKDFDLDVTRNGNDGFGNIQNTSSVRAAHHGEQNDIFASDSKTSDRKEAKSADKTSDKKQKKDSNMAATRNANDGFGNIQNTSSVRADHEGEHDEIYAVDKKGAKSADNKSTDKKQKKDNNMAESRNANDGFGNIQNTSAVRADHEGENKDIYAVDKKDNNKRSEMTNLSFDKKQQSGSDGKAFNMADGMMETAALSGNNQQKSNQDRKFDNQRGMQEDIRNEGVAKEAVRKTGEQLKAGWKDVKDAVKDTVQGNKNLRQDKSMTEGDEGLDRHMNEKPQSAEHGERNARVPKKEPTRYGDWEHTGRTTDF
jgi:hypothetical protein